MDSESFGGAGAAGFRILMNEPIVLTSAQVDARGSIGIFHCEGYAGSEVEGISEL
jgi:hypothetical protein